MVISNSTMVFITQIVDYNQEYNTKFIILFVLLFYSLFLLWLSFKLPQTDPRWNPESPDSRFSFLLLQRFYRWVCGSYVFIFPLMLLMLMREASIFSLFNLVFGFYIVIFSGTFIPFSIIYAMEFLLNAAGIHKDRGGFSRKRR